MKKIKIIRLLVLATISFFLLNGSALAEESTSEKTSQEADGETTKIDSARMKKVRTIINDRAVTVKAKAVLADDKSINSNDIAIETHQGVVTLSGFVSSQAQAEKAITVVKKVEGVKSVSDQLHVKDTQKQSLKGYADDAMITSKIKAKFLEDDLVPSLDIKVKTTNAIVQLSGEVSTEKQSDRAEYIANAIEGVKSVKNDLKVKVKY